MIESIKDYVKRKLGMDYRSKCVREVLMAFKAMGADIKEVKRERARLMKDDMYLAEWHVACNPPKDLIKHLFSSLKKSTTQVGGRTKDTSQTGSVE